MPGRGTKRDYRRAYKACLECRKKKSRCIRGDGPCNQCVRQRTACVLDDSQQPKRQKTSFSNNGPILTESDQGWQALAAPACDLNTTSTTYRSTSSHERTDDVLTNSVVRTVISSGNDAFKVLFDVAPDQIQCLTEPARSTSAVTTSTNPSMTDAHNGVERGTSPPSAHVSPLHMPSYPVSLIRTWQSCQFVSMGWLTAREAIEYVDIFFKNMSPLSPVLTTFFSDHANHLLLITEEPMLCCTILMISSRYHVLPQMGGSAKGYFLHNRLWKHCEHLILRVMLGQEKGAQTKARSVGTIEALLLISEWHPRSLHFPPESHGWDADLHVCMSDHPGPDTETADIGDDTATPSLRWLEEVIEPTRRSDRMSWMLLGTAISLAHELGIFAPETYLQSVAANHVRELQRVERNRRVQKLLYIYHTQLALRLGHVSSMSTSLHHVIPATRVASSERITNESLQWNRFFSALMDLTKLSMSIKDVFFASASSTRTLLVSGRYRDLIEDYRHLLGRWHEQHLSSEEIANKSFSITINIEYRSIQALLNSVGMQAIVERSLQRCPGGFGDQHLSLTGEHADYEYVQGVLESCSNILEIFQEYECQENLVRLPSRVVYRIFTSSVLLLKALSIGVRQAQLERSLEILSTSIEALQSNKLDELLCVPRYASLLSLRLKSLRRYFIRSLKHVDLSGGLEAGSDWSAITVVPQHGPYDFQLPDIQDPELQSQLGWPNQEEEALFRLPFDPSMAPFDLSGSQAMSNVDLNGLDFVWNVFS